MSTMQDYADKTWLRKQSTRPSQESTFEKVAAVSGLVFMLVFVAGMMILPAVAPHVR